MEPSINSYDISWDDSITLDINGACLEDDMFLNGSELEDGLFEEVFGSDDSGGGDDQ
ncbi:hypothetical protein F441_10448 [Phytophthora nicotianae CJ01A1]|uniref:Uncharacterized protein n=3 Tax=Phytophthora nicotianae TaxID=4792 RepID=W2Z6P0_PHYNI|nr:hypothetical protein L916_10170 [Phytophthora nicotianae]ETP14628.1 hypothetical protein F441_10448 [Phytophthora nicotianae CJ01A1]ETP42710.1 hypothetical protein F442_10407 [Phytophthora nicotianae P10297]